MKPYRVTILASTALLAVAANLPADQSKVDSSDGSEQASSLLPRPPGQGQAPTKTVVRPPAPPPKTPSSIFRGPNPPPG